MRILRQTLILLAFPLLAFLAYSNTFHSPFQFDDRPHIEENTHIRMTDLSWQEMADVFKSGIKTRLVPMISFALNYYFGRYDVVGYHLVNLLIHGINAILLYLFLRTTLGLLPNPLPHPFWVAFVATLLWLLHPVQIQSVTYIIQRINSMAAMFYILSLLLYARGRILQRQRAGSLQDPKAAPRLKARFPPPLLWFGGSVLAGMLAMGSKEISITLPFFVLLYEWYFFQDLSAAWLRRSLPWVLAAGFLAAALAIVHLGSSPLAGLLSLYDYWYFTLPQRVMTEFRVVLYYVSLLFYPHPSRLNLDYEFPLSYSLFEPPTTLLSLCVIAGLVALACWFAKPNRLLSFCILWFFGNLVVESSLIPLDLVFEHRLYLPSMLASLLVVAWVYRYVRPMQFATGLLFAVAVLLSVWTYQRNEVWRDPVTLWSDTLKKSPNRARPHSSLGEALAHRGDLEQAIAHYGLAIRVSPNNEKTHSNLGIALAQQGNPEAAKVYLRQALRINPEYGKAYYNLGIVLEGQGNLDEAIANYRRAVRFNPDLGDAHNNLGNALVRQGNLDEAIIHYRKALRILAEDANAHNNLGIVLFRQERLEDAITHYREAIRIKPGFPDAHSNLGIALAMQGNLQEAISHYRQALRMNPDFANAHYNLANALAKQGNLEEAQVHYQQAKRIIQNIRTPMTTP